MSDVEKMSAAEKTTVVEKTNAGATLATETRDGKKTARGRAENTRDTRGR